MPLRLDLTPTEQITEAWKRMYAAKADLVCAILQARKEGRSWQEVGDAIGISRQAAWEQWKHLDQPS